MNDLPLIRRFSYNLLGLVLYSTHWTDNHNLLGIRLSTFLKFVTFFLGIIAIFRRWGFGPITALLGLFLFLQFGYWLSRRNGYYLFVGKEPPDPKREGIPLLPANKRVPILATGIFSVIDYEKNLLFIPANYWQVPMGDHVVMVEHQPGKFLYQFFKAETLRERRCGWLLFGLKPKPALAITFLSSWGPEFNELKFDLLGREKSKPVTKMREIYFSFYSTEDKLTIWNNLEGDIQRPYQPTVPDS